MIHHIAIVVNDLENSKNFYKEVFDFPEIPREQSNAVRPKGAWLQIGNVELHLQYREEKQPKTDQHFAILVKDLASTCAKAASKRARVEESKPLTGFSKRAFIYDLDDNRIEVLEK